MEQNNNISGSTSDIGPDAVSDDELLSLRLTYADPRAEFDLVWKVPQGVEMLKIVGNYGPNDGEFHCVRPGCGTRHKKGFVVLLSNETHIVIGHICGRRLFGESWDQYKGNYDRLVRRQRLLIRQADLLSKEDAILNSLRELREPFKRSDGVRRNWREGMKELWHQLQEAVLSHDGQLRVVTKVDQSYREAIRDVERSVGRGRRSAIGVEQMETVHVLLGQEFFRSSARPRLEKSINAISSVLAKLSEPGLSNSSITRQLVAFDHAVADVQRIIGTHNAALDALSEANLAGIYKWAKRVEGDRRYAFKDGELIQRAGHGDPTQRISCDHGINRVKFEIRRLFQPQEADDEAA